MKLHINVILRTTDYRGDHSADVGIACEVLPDETVENLVERLLSRDLNRAVDWIELRRVRP